MPVPAKYRAPGTGENTVCGADIRCRTHLRTLSVVPWIHWASCFLASCFRVLRGGVFSAVVAAACFRQPFPPLFVRPCRRPRFYRLRRRSRSNSVPNLPRDLWALDGLRAARLSHIQLRQPYPGRPRFLCQSLKFSFPAIRLRPGDAPI